MKQQRNAIKAAAAVDANLGEIETPQSRFVDAGFISTGGRNVDWGGKFLNAAKAGIDAYHATDDYQQEKRTNITKAKRAALDWTKGTEDRAKEQGVAWEDMDNFLKNEMEQAVSRLTPGPDDEPDDSISRAYKDQFFNDINSRYTAMASTAQNKYKAEQKVIAKDQSLTDITDGIRDFNATQDILKTDFSPSEISAIWVQGATSRVSKLSNEFEATYNDYLIVEGNVKGDILKQIKASELSPSDYLKKQGKSLDELVKDRIKAQGVTNPFEDYIAEVNSIKNQEGTDGIGKLVELNNTTSKSLASAIIKANATVQGFAYSSKIAARISNGVGSIDVDIANSLTTSDSVNKDIKERAKVAAIKAAADNFYTVINPNADDTSRALAATWLDSFIFKNPEYVSDALTPITNQMAYDWKNAVDSSQAGRVSSFLSDMDRTLWDTNIGSATRQQLLKAVGQDFERAMIAHRAGVNELHITALARGDLPESTQDDYKNTLGAENYQTLKDSYYSAVEESVPYASPKEKEAIVKMALDFDRWGIGIDKQKFFDKYGENMHHNAKTPATDMGVGEPNIVNDWLSPMKVPLTGAFKEINAMDAQNPGWTQGMFHHMLANANPVLRQQLAATLDIEVSEKAYMVGGKPSDKKYHSFDFSEGVTDDWNTPQITRWGDNDWIITLGKDEWLDEVLFDGPRTQFVISNEELRQANASFTDHYRAYNKDAGKTSLVAAENEEAREKAFKDVYGPQGWDRIINWFTLPSNRTKEE